MLPIPLSTVDELIRLGSKIADIVTVLLSRKATQEEQKQAQAAVQQFNQLKRAHLEIKTLLEEYNRIFGQAILTQGGVQALFSLCTHQGFKEAEQLYVANMQYQVSHQELVAFELLSVKLVTQISTEVSSSSTKEVHQQWAEVYTYEKWITVYQTGRKAGQEMVDRYQIIWQDGSWKIHHGEFFGKIMTARG